MQNKKTKQKQNRSQWASCNAMRMGQRSCQTHICKKVAKWLHQSFSVSQLTTLMSLWPNVEQIQHYGLIWPQRRNSLLCLPREKRENKEGLNDITAAQITDRGVWHLSHWAVTWQEQISTLLTVTNNLKHLCSSQKSLPALDTSVNL